MIGLFCRKKEVIFLDEELRFLISVKSDGAEDASQKTTSAIQQIGQAYTATQTKLQNGAKAISQTMNNITTAVRTAASTMQNQYSSMSVEKLSSEFIKLEERIIKQRTAVQQTEQALAEYAAMWERIAASESRVASTADNDAELAQLARSANEAAAELRSLEAAQQQVAAAMTAQTQYSQQMDITRQKTAQTKVGIDAMAFSLATVGRATGGTIGQIVTLAEEVRYLKQAFSSTAQTAGTMATTISTGLGAVGIAFMAITMIVGAITKAEEEAKKKAQELREEIRALSQDRVGAASLVAEYETLSNKIIRTADDTQRMLDIRAELVDTYGFSIAAVSEEGQLLAGNLETMKEQLKVSQQLLLSKLLENQTNDIKSYNDELSKQAGILGEIAYWTSMKETITSSEIWKNGTAPQTAIDAVENFGNKVIEFEGKLVQSKNVTQSALENLIQTMVLTLSLKGKDVPEALQTSIIDTLNSKLENAFKSNTDYFYEDATSTAQGMVDAYFEISDHSKAESAIADVQNLKNQLKAAFSSVDDTDPQIAGDTIDNIVNALLGDDSANEKILARVSELKQKIYQGLASTDDMAVYDQLVSTINDSFVKAQSAANRAVESGLPGADKARGIIGDLAKKYLNSSSALIKQAAAEKATASSAKDLSDEIETLHSSFEELNVKTSKAKGLQEAADILKNSTPDTKEYAKALEYLKDKGYGALLDDIETAIPNIEAEAQALAEAAALEHVELQGQGNIVAAVIAQKLQEAKDAGNQKGIETYTAMQSWINNILGLFGNLSTMGVKSDFSTYKPPKSSGGGGSKKNKALDREIAQLEHYKALDQLTTAEEIVNLERVLARYAKTTDEKRELTEKLYDLRKKLAEDELEYQKSTDQLTLREEIAMLDKMIAMYKEGTDARRSLEQQRYEAARELEQQEYDLKVYYGQLTLDEQAAAIQQMISTYKEGVDARIELEKELYDVQQQIAQRNLEYKMSMDQMTLQEEIAALDQMIAQHKEGTEARLELEQRRYEASRELERQEYDLKVYYGELTLQEQEEQIKQMISTYKEGVAARIELEKELYDVQQQIRNQDVKRLDDLSNAVISALRERYEAQRETETETLQASIEAWKTWGNEQVAAIQAQIKALDELTKQEDNAEVEAAKRKKISMLEQELMYEQDAYNRRKLQEQLAAAQDDLNKWLRDQERAALKASLQDQITAVNETVASEQDKLQQQIDANNEYYEELTKAQNLQAEAQRLLMQSSQTEIIDLLKAFAPEYNATGQSLGEQLVDGFMSRVGDIEAWFANLTASLTSRSQLLASVGTAAADQFYATRGIQTGGDFSAKRETSKVITVGDINLHFDKQNMTPSEVRREILRLLEDISQLE